MRYVAVIALVVAGSLSAHGQDRLVTEDLLRGMNLDSLVKKPNAKEVDARGDEPTNRFAEDRLEEMWANPELGPIPDDAHAESAHEQVDAIMEALFPADEVQPPQKAAGFFVVPEGQKIGEPNLGDPDEAAILANKVLLALSPAEEEKIRILKEMEERRKAQLEAESSKKEDLKKQDEALRNKLEEQIQKQKEDKQKAQLEAQRRAEEANLKQLNDAARLALEARRAALDREKDEEVARVARARAVAEEIYKKPSIWPAWVGAVPAYSAAYSEVAPARIAGFKALYEGEARGVDLDGNAVDGLFSVEFHSGGGDTVNMLGTLLGLEFGSVLSASSANNFSAVTDPGTADTSAGPGEYYGAGRLQGRFYGAGHEGVGGTFNLYGASDVTGHFVGAAP